MFPDPCLCTKSMCSPAPGPRRSFLKTMTSINNKYGRCDHCITRTVGLTGGLRIDNGRDSYFVVACSSCLSGLFIVSPVSGSLPVNVASNESTKEKQISTTVRPPWFRPSHLTMAKPHWFPGKLPYTDPGRTPPRYKNAGR